MKRTNTQQPQPVTPGFAILLTHQTDLGNAMLIAEDDAGGYQPIGLVSTLSEAIEIAAARPAGPDAGTRTGRHAFLPRPLQSLGTRTGRLHGGRRIPIPRNSNPNTKGKHLHDNVHHR